MTPASEQSPRLARNLEPILAVAGKLAAPFDLQTMLAEVVDAAQQVLAAERASVWLYEQSTDELIMKVATDIAPVRVPAGVGIAGSCARTREIINVPDCYADPRFNREVDRKSGYRTRCMLTLPLIDHKDTLVGVMQVLNKSGGVFDLYDEALAAALAGQCAVALQRVRMTEALFEAEKMRQEMETARVVQMSTLPATMPTVRGYDVYGTFRPASMTGGDTFDLAHTEHGFLVVLGDATGHGLAPALSVMQMHAMLRTALRLGTDLDTAYLQVNNQLAETLPDDRFITAFIGLLDIETHRLRFHSGGQGPILCFRPTTQDFSRRKPTSFPLAAMPLPAKRAAVKFDFEAGDVLVLLSDGIYEYHNAQGEQFGEQRVEDLVRAHHTKPMAELSALLLQAVQDFAQGAPQEDDMTVVLVKREAVRAEHRLFERRIDSLQQIFEFTASSFARLGIDRDYLHAIDFTVEELFTNMVKYSRESSAAVRLDLTRIEGGVEATLTDYEVDRFDPTQAPDARVDLPIEQRTPGGLGLHLIRRLVDAIEYHYSSETRQSRITFRKTAGTATPHEGPAGTTENNAHD